MKKSIYQSRGLQKVFLKKIFNQTVSIKIIRQVISTNRPSLGYQSAESTLTIKIDPWKIKRRKETDMTVEEK